MGLNDWTVSRPYPSAGLSYQDVAYGRIAGNDWFVAVGSRSLLQSNDEGETWSHDTVSMFNPPTPSQVETYNAVAYGDGVFVAVGTHKTSWNGSAWSTQITQATPSGWARQKHLNAIAYGNPTAGGLFVAVGDAGTVLTSADGLAWTDRTSGDP